jgi:predicted GNAT family N-acyltransferase
MTSLPNRWHAVPFNGKVHDRTVFSCGADSLDHYIRQQASQDLKRDVARIFVAVPDEGQTVLGYYSLSAGSFKRDDLPATQARCLPHYPVPSVLLGRLAVDNSMKGRGLGAWLLTDALNRIALASETLAVHAVIVDALDANAAAFYEKYGFVPFPSDTRRLFLPMATVRQVVFG